MMRDKHTKTNGGDSVHMVQCVMFDARKRKKGNGCVRNLRRHVLNVKEFIEFKSKNHPEMERVLFEAVATSRKWKATALTSLSLNNQLEWGKRLRSRP